MVDERTANIGQWNRWVERWTDYLRPEMELLDLEVRVEAAAGGSSGSVEEENGAGGEKGREESGAGEHDKSSLGGTGQSSSFFGQSGGGGHHHDGGKEVVPPWVPMRKDVALGDALELWQRDTDGANDAELYKGLVYRATLRIGVTEADRQRYYEESKYTFSGTGHQRVLENPRKFAAKAVFPPTEVSDTDVENAADMRRRALLASPPPSSDSAASSTEDSKEPPAVVPTDTNVFRLMLRGKGIDTELRVPVSMGKLSTPPAKVWWLRKLCLLYQGSGNFVTQSEDALADCGRPVYGNFPLENLPADGSSGAALDEEDSGASGKPIGGGPGKTNVTVLLGNLVVSEDEGTIVQLVPSVARAPAAVPLLPGFVNGRAFPLFYTVQLSVRSDRDPFILLDGKTDFGLQRSTALISGLVLLSTALCSCTLPLATFVSWFLKRAAERVAQEEEGGRFEAMLEGGEGDEETPPAPRNMPAD